MFVGITGDTHNAPGLTSIKPIEGMLVEMSKFNPRIVIHLGDVGETRIHIGYVEDVIQMMNFYFPNAKIGIVWGNHDLWVDEDEDWDSMQLWAEMLPQLAKNFSMTSLDGDTLIVDGVAVVGSYLHYDYSAKDIGGLASREIKLTSGLTEDEYYAKYKHRINNDGKYLIGLPSDKEFAATIGKEFRQRLQAAEDNPAVTDIVIVTHVPCMPTQVTHNPMDLNWSLGTPYFANLSHVGFIKSLTKVRYVVSCHSHRGNESTVEFDDGHSVEVINLDADYNAPTFRTIEI